MNPEEKRILEETLSLARENHKMLRTMRRHAWFGLCFKILVWAVLILAPLYFYQKYLEPIMGQFQSATGGKTGTVAGTGLFGFPTSADIQKLIEQYKAQ